MIDFLLDIMRFDSTSGKENELAKYIYKKYKPRDAGAEIQETKLGRLNIFFKWGVPKIIFCSHLDTVPPYIPPSKEKEIIKGRGSCDAKGQLAYLFECCIQLRAEGFNNFGMLMVSGEEDGSQGAYAANARLNDCEFIFIGEPTENKLIKASKGNISIDLSFKGKSCHSGYPHLGDNAITKMFSFIQILEKADFEEDELLGRTTYNIGMLESKNAHNVVPDLVTLKLFLRTTFITHSKIINYIKNILPEKSEMKVLYEHLPIKFSIVEGFETGVVSFGTDAPAFSNIKNKILYGPGSISDAHTENEYIKTGDLYKAVEDIKIVYKKIINENCS
ncbi:MAG: M20/M25/M40 family metallo-hydrolase [Bacteroidota bacterium]|nr:M20/M25/M40 family metallo-hydrolase [Bacteroidota bacterium]